MNANVFSCSSSWGQLRLTSSTWLYTWLLTYLYERATGCGTHLELSLVEKAFYQRLARRTSETAEIEISSDQAARLAWKCISLECSVHIWCMAFVQDGLTGHEQEMHFRKVRKIRVRRTRKERMRYEPSGNARRFPSARSSDLHNIKDKQDCPLSTAHPCDVSESCSEDAGVVLQTFKIYFTCTAELFLPSLLSFLCSSNVRFNGLSQCKIPIIACLKNIMH